MVEEKEEEKGQGEDTVHVVTVNSLEIMDLHIFQRVIISPSREIR